MLCVSDVECSTVWYRDKLGFEVLKLLTPPKSPPWGGWRCFAHDPDGYLVEIEDWAIELHRA